MIRELQAIVTKLFENEEYQCSQTKQGRRSCLQAEEERPLKKSEKLLGDVIRTFNAYNPDNMCCTCRAYWHVSCAQQALERRERLRHIEEFEKTRAT